MWTHYNSVSLPSLCFVSSQSYRMSSSPRGFAMVVSNVNFDSSSGLDLRKGGEVDEDVLKNVFTELDFHTIVRRNLTAQVKRVTFSSLEKNQNN